MAEAPALEDNPNTRQKIFVRFCIDLFDDASALSISEYFDPENWSKIGQNDVVTIKKTYNDLAVYTWRTEYIDIS